MLFDALYFAGGSWTTRSPPLLRVLPWGDMWWCGHGNIPRVTLQGDSRVPSPSLSPGKTSYGMFGMISLSHCICRACRREGRERIILCTTGRCLRQQQHILKSHCRTSYSNKHRWVRDQRHPNGDLPDTQGPEGAFGCSSVHVRRAPTRREHRDIPKISCHGGFQCRIVTQLPPCPCTPETISGRETGTRSFWDRTPLPLSNV